MIALEGIGPGGGPEENRALAYLKVTHNGLDYDWQAFIPSGMTIPDFQAWIEPRVYAEIDAKEREWALLNPKTREVVDPMSGQTTIEEIQKSEIVRPEIPDYFAKRRAAYPPVGDQLDAYWKGGQAATDMAAKIQAVKDQYPKP